MFYGACAWSALFTYIHKIDAWLTQVYKTPLRGVIQKYAEKCYIFFCKLSNPFDTYEIWSSIYFEYWKLISKHV